jgi:hypothetical protein
VLGKKKKNISNSVRNSKGKEKPGKGFDFQQISGA